LTGFLLTQRYIPDAGKAYGITDYLSHTFGWSFIVNFHYWSADLIFLLVIVALEGAARALRERAPGRFSDWAFAVAILALVVTIAGGLGLYVRGERPRETLHFI